MDHVYPLNDEKEHDVSDEATTCHCGPRIDWSGPVPLMIHRSFDGRELIEEAERIKDMVEESL